MAANIRHLTGKLMKPLDNKKGIKLGAGSKKDNEKLLLKLKLKPCYLIKITSPIIKATLRS